MPNVSVTAVNNDTGITRTTTSSDTGAYVFAQMPIGTYKITVSAEGFKTVVSSAMVATGTTTRADIVLQIGQRNETVTVEGEAPLMDLTPNENNFVDNLRIENMPLNGRDFNSLLAMTPGVQRTPGGGFLAVSINGSRTTSNNYFIDGLYNNDRYYGDSAINQTGVVGIPATMFPPEAIQELSVQENPSAEFGVKGGAPILLGDEERDQRLSRMGAVDSAHRLCGRGELSFRRAMDAVIRGVANRRHCGICSLAAA